MCEWGCEACRTKFGMVGTGPWNPTTKTGQLTTSCKRCAKVFVSRFKDGKLQLDEPCYTAGCAGPVEVMDGKCPKCGKERLYFIDPHMRCHQAVDLRDK